ncbi:hypothetical protein C7212DRAFT_348692 [Tuber magnatum]|uniref:mitogen-activated protein kinase n=1 Tax=Tuber magnatum TaxID=42249 RepID=A0A317SDQ3_9PEZI|nr:hypothetical protein C7212DRAFT_348692 [Tuber magnatum]
MGSRQRSASALSQHNAVHSSTPSPGGMGGGSGNHTLHDPVDSVILNAAEIPTFHGNSLPIPTFGAGSAYPTITQNRPRAHTSADSSPSNVGAMNFGGLQPRQPSRNSMMQGHPVGMGLRHVSTPVLDGGSRVRGDGNGGVGGGGGGGGGVTGNGFPVGSPPVQGGMMVPPPPPPPLPPAKDAGYVPHQASVGRSHGREGMMNYHYASHHHHPQQQQYGAYAPHQPSASSSAASLPQPQLPPLSVPHQNGLTNGNNNPIYTPHLHAHAHPHAHHPPHRPPEPLVYRQQSTQSSESIASSFTRTESNTDSEYMTSATATSSASASALAGSRSVSNGITRSSHVSHSHSQQSPLVSNAAGPLSPDVATVWTLDSVVAYLNRHEFSEEWQEAFRNLNIHGAGFLEMGQHNSASLLQIVLPEVLRICGPSADPVKEKLAARNIKKMVREILKLSQEIPNTPPPVGHNPPENGESLAMMGGTSQRSPVQTRFPTQRGATFPTSNIYSDGSHNASEPFLPRGGSENTLQHRVGTSESRSRNEFSKGALATADQISRHSPSNSDAGIRDPIDGHVFGKQALSSSPRNSPHLGHQSVVRHEPISTRHGKSNSQESVASGTVNHRPGDGKGKEKALIILGITPNERPIVRQDYDGRSSSSGLVDRFRKKFRREPSDDDNEDGSPTGPGTPNLPFTIPEGNASDSSLDQVSVSSVDALGRRGGNPRSVPGGGTLKSGKSVYVFATRDGKVWVSIDVTSLEKGGEIRKEICRNLGINDYDAAAIHLTEVGQEPNEETLTDQMLKLSCQTRGDGIASLKFFVQPVPMSAFDLPVESSIGQILSSTPPPQSYASDPPSRLANTGSKPQPLQIERTQKQLNRRSSSPHLLISSGDSTLKQSDIAGSAETLPNTGLNGSGNQPRDDLDDLRERLALLRRHQDQGPKINVIPTPSIGPTPPGPHSSVQPSPNDHMPEPGSAYSSYTGWENDYSESPPPPPLKPLLRTATNGSPSDTGLPSTVRKNELFFDEEPSPSTNFAVLTHGTPHKGSAGTNQLGAAAQIRRQGLETIAQQQQQQEQQTGRLTKKKKEKETDTERPSAGFQRVQTATRSGRVVDFDNPRPSPYEDVKMETLIPQRKPPPPPSNRSSIGSISRVGSDFGRGLPADAGGRYAPATRRVSTDRTAAAIEKAPEMSERAWRKGVSPLHEDRQSPVTGIGSSLISAGILSAQITRTPIPHVPRESVSAPSLPSYNQQAAPRQQQQQYQQQGQQIQESPRPRTMAAVDFGHSGTSSPQSGGTPSSPGFTWGKGNQLFKIPDYQPEYEAGPEKLTLQIPTAPLPRQSSPEISPGDRDVPLGIRKSTLPVGAPIDIQGNDVQFLSQATPTSAEPRAQEGEEDEDSDEDDGLFAIPISSRGEKPKTEFPKTEERNMDSPRPTLTIATKNVTFKATPTTSATASGSNGAMNSPEFEEGDDKLGLNSPASHSISAPGSAAASAHSPADYMRLGRRESFGKEDVWASRPPAEALIDHLDDFFPGLNLDQPIPDEVGVSPPPSPSPATENKPLSYQLADIPSESPSASEPPGAMGPPPPPVSKGKNVPTVAQRNTGRSQLVRLKSIREVAKGAHEKSKRFTQTNTAGSKSGDISRRKSTKMFGARLIEVTPTKRGAILQAQQAPPPVQQQSGIKRQATFRWFKGQLIGKGTYGRVYLGMNATTGEFLAVKQVEVSKGLSDNDSDRQKEMIAALNQEIETMQHLDHVNIVQYLGCERKEMNMSIFLEYISGGSVGSCLRKHGPFEEPVVRSLTRQTLSGLEYLHREGILHRDLKADNILLDIDGTCKISDFGISKKSDNIYGDDPGNSMQGSVFWMAPEVIRPEGQGYSAKIDIWSLGCVVLEMFAGRRPWSKEEAIGAIYKLGSERQAPPIPDDVAEVISPSAIGFLADCHTVEPSERPTAATLLNKHEFCSLDPNFNFLDTSLYQKIRGLKF